MSLGTSSNVARDIALTVSAQHVVQTRAQLISGHVDAIYAAAAQGVCCATSADANHDLFVLAMTAAVLQEFAVFGDIAAVLLLQFPTVNEQPSQSFEQQLMLEWGPSWRSKAHALSPGGTRTCSSRFGSVPGFRK